jgi:hypothetical protein
VPPGYDATIIWEGLGILPYAVAPHYESTHPESAAVRKLVTHFIDQHIAFKALRDGQALVIDGERQAVVGYARCPTAADLVLQPTFTAWQCALFGAGAAVVLILLSLAVARLPLARPLKAA